MIGGREKGCGHWVREVFLVEVAISSLDPTNEETDMGRSREAVSDSESF